VWEQGNKNSVRTSVRLASSHHDSHVLVPEVPEVPDVSENSINGASGIAKTTDKQGFDSGSQICEQGASIERFRLCDDWPLDASSCATSTAVETSRTKAFLSGWTEVTFS
jgi:hypothetical protein